MSSFSEAVKRLIRSRLYRYGIVVRRDRPGGPPPPIFEDPLEALVVRRGGVPAAFTCPLDRCVSFNGFNFGGGGWHPFVATAMEIGRTGASGYPGSVLERYYAIWQPQNAAAALIGCTSAKMPAMERLPSYAYVLPWLSVTPEQFKRDQEIWVERENARYGRVSLPIAAGYNHHGPVTREKGEIEYRRLTNAYTSISAVGYERERGHVEVTQLKRGDEYRYYLSHGHHRSAASSALSATTVPAVYSPTRIVDVDEAAYWPQVRRGVWPLEAATRYYDHLFDFDSRGWARGLGLDAASGSAASAAP
jgi:hypothetical protein